MKDFFSFCKKFKRSKTRKMDNLNKVLNVTRPVVSGLLHKYTNVVKGFQIRYCKVDAENGLLCYYLCENGDEHLNSNTPRGTVQLIGALINPSDEDSRTFTINSASGDIIKLKANDAKSRQEWVDGLRAVVENLSSQSRSTKSTKEHLATYDCLIASRKQLQETESCNADLCRMIENCDFHTDKDFLLMKALSSATTSTLSQALVYLQKYNESTRNELY